MTNEFAVHRLNERGLAAADKIADRFGALLLFIEDAIPVSRERALVVTKLQEACFFAKRGIALLPENQADEAPQ
jgi:hypothetical protein